MRGDDSPILPVLTLHFRLAVTAEAGVGLTTKGSAALRSATTAAQRLRGDGSNQLVERVGNKQCEIREVRHGITVGDEAETYGVHIAQHRDVQPESIEEGAERIERLNATAGDVQRKVRAGDVRDNDVVR